MKQVKHFLILSMLFFAASALAQGPAGLVIVESQNDIDTTQAKLEAAIEGADGLNIMTVIDHAANAEGAGLDAAAPHPPCYFWQPECRYAAYAGRTISCHRPASENAYLGRRIGYGFRRL